MSKEQTKFQQQFNWYLSLFVLLLVLIVPPILCSLFYLSQVPEVMWQRNDQLTFDRIWMYREHRPVGIAYQTQRVVEYYNSSEVCVQNDLHFFLWGQTTEARPASSGHRMILMDNRWQSSGEECDK